MNIVLYHTRACHIYKTARKELENELKNASISTEIKTVVVTTQKDAEQNRFLGSPTIHINGKDVDPMAEKMTTYGLSACRTYWWKGKSFEFPPKQMIAQALKT